MANTETKFVHKCRLNMASHPLWIGVYSRIEVALLTYQSRRTKELEHDARLYPLGPTLRDMERIGLIAQDRNVFAGKGPFYNPAWRLSGPPLFQRGERNRMPYKYETEKKVIFTEEGQRKFLKVRDRVGKLLTQAGAVRMQEAMRGIGGDSWECMAYIDRLVELGEIRELTENDDHVPGQYRVFVQRGH